jgi:hypothetical protein
MKISEVTKRNILDELLSNGIVWWGRLDNREFRGHVRN